MLCIGFCWKELNLQRLSRMVVGKNEPAMRAYKKAGFEQEDLLKRAILTNRVYMDATIMGLLRSDYRPLAPLGMPMCESVLRNASCN